MVRLGWCPKPKIAPNFDLHCSNSTNLIFTKFSASFEHPRGCRTPSKYRKSVDRVPSKEGQNMQKCQISNPHISPKWGPIPPPPTKNHFSQGRQGYKQQGSDGGCGPPKGVTPHSAPPPIFENPFFRNPLVRFLPKAYGGRHDI